MGADVIRGRGLVGRRSRRRGALAPAPSPPKPRARSAGLALAGWLMAPEDLGHRAADLADRAACAQCLTDQRQQIRAPGTGFAQLVEPGSRSFRVTRCPDGGESCDLLAL